MSIVVLLFSMIHISIVPKFIWKKKQRRKETNTNEPKTKSERTESRENTRTENRVAGGEGW